MLVFFKKMLSMALFTALATGLFGQKIEIEKKVSPEEFPAAALEYLNERYPDRGRTRHFLESGSDSTNFEAKFKWQGHCFSIEFFQDGKLKDSEREVKFAALPADLQQQVAARFQRDFKKFKVKKVQEQTLPGSSEPNYEIVVKGKAPDGRAFFEYLFAADGSVVLSQKIILPSNNITLY